jgi:hypothetical protein
LELDSVHGAALNCVDKDFKMSDKEIPKAPSSEQFSLQMVYHFL